VVRASKRNTFRNITVENWGCRILSKGKGNLVVETRGTQPHLCLTTHFEGLGKNPLLMIGFNALFLYLQR
jgi:hypothetical protein